MLTTWLFRSLRDCITRLAMLLMSVAKVWPLRMARLRVETLSGWLRISPMLEKKSFTRVYRVAAIEDRSTIRANGFRPSTEFGGIQKMISGDVLIVAEDLDGAHAFGDGEYGPGHYDVYEIDATSWMKRLPPA